MPAQLTMSNLKLEEVFKLSMKLSHQNIRKYLF